MSVLLRLIISHGYNDTTQGRLKVSAMSLNGLLA